MHGTNLLLIYLIKQIPAHTATYSAISVHQHNTTYITHLFGAVCHNRKQETSLSSRINVYCNDITHTYIQKAYHSKYVYIQTYSNGMLLRWLPSILLMSIVMARGEFFRKVERETAWNLSQLNMDFFRFLFA